MHWYVWRTCSSFCAGRAPPHISQHGKRHCVFFFPLLQDHERRTPLHAAACVGDVHIMDLLIESGEWAACIADFWLCVIRLSSSITGERAQDILWLISPLLNPWEAAWRSLHNKSCAHWVWCVLLRYLILTFAPGGKMESSSEDEFWLGLHEQGECHLLIFQVHFRRSNLCRQLSRHLWQMR